MQYEDFHQAACPAGGGCFPLPVLPRARRGRQVTAVLLGLGALHSALACRLSLLGCSVHVRSALRSNFKLVLLN